MTLESVRSRIDKIDHEVLRLLAERMVLGIRSRRYKTSVRDKAREQGILKSQCQRACSFGVFQKKFIRNIYTEIMKESNEIQKQGKSLIGFQGKHGAYSELAATGYSPSLIPVSCRHFADVFDEVERDDLDFGIVPVENSLGGSIQQVNELLIDRDIHVIGAIRQRINHCLMTLPETQYRDIKTVVSHPAALDQCRGFIQRLGLESHPFYDTAGAAEMLTRERPKTTAVIASRLCGDIYDLEIIKENIQDHPENYTRFMVLARRAFAGSSQKTSIIFSTPHKAGALLGILQIFSESRFNLTRIESLPCKDEPGNYVFFLDFLCDTQSEDVKNVMNMVKQKTGRFKHLGSYNEQVFP